MDLQGMQSMVLTLGNGQIWLGTSPVALNLFQYSSTLSAVASSQKTFVLILTLGK